MSDCRANAKFEKVAAFAFLRSLCVPLRQKKSVSIGVHRGFHLHPLHERSLAHYLTEPVCKAGPPAVEPNAWITENRYNRELEVTEESWNLDGYDSVLTLLVLFDSDDAREEDMIAHYERKALGLRL